MKRKIFLVGALLLSPLVGIFVAAREAASWRPVRVGSAPGSYSLSVSRGGWIQTRTTRGVMLQREGHILGERTFQSAFLSPDESLVALSGDKGEVFRIVRMRDEKVICLWRKLPLQAGEVLEAGHFENDNRVFVVASRFRVLRLDVRSGRALSQVKMRFRNKLDEGCVVTDGVSFLKNGDLFYLNCDQGLVVDGRTGIPKRKTDAGNLSPDGSLTWICYPDTGECSFQDFKTGTSLWSANISGLPAFSPDSRFLLIVQNNKVRLVNARDGKLIRDLNILPADNYAFSSDGDALYSLQQDGQILRWRLR